MVPCAQPGWVFGNNHPPGSKVKPDRNFPSHPLLFSLAIKTLARKICDNSQIQRVNTEGVEGIIPLCTGDTLPYIISPDTSAPAACGLAEGLVWLKSKSEHCKDCKEENPSGNIRPSVV